MHIHVGLLDIVLIQIEGCVHVFKRSIILLRLEFLENLDIVAMFSSEGEKVQMSTSISTSAARGAVEKWLLQVQDTMIVSVRDVTAKARDVSIMHAQQQGSGVDHVMLWSCTGLRCGPPY